MTSRRNLLVGALASTILPVTSWSQIGTPTHLSAAREPDGHFAMYGLREDGSIAFRVGLPQRGHAAAAHPDAPQAVAFARRPGTFALVLDCSEGGILQRLNAPKGHHFYGHGAFSANGSLLFTTENHVETGQGVVGIWDYAAGYVRLGQVPSHGIGPHEIVRLPDGGFAVANGGIRTHPDKGRAKLNLETMRPNLALLDANGNLRDLAEVPVQFHKNSLRHIAVRKDGQVACGFQWQGDRFDVPPLLAIYSDSELQFIEFPETLGQRMAGYVGSVSWVDEHRVLLSSPRGGILVVHDTLTLQTTLTQIDDVCGVSSGASGGLVTDGLGRVHGMRANKTQFLARHDLAFDNHLVRIDATT